MSSVPKQLWRRVQRRSGTRSEPSVEALSRREAHRAGGRSLRRAYFAWMDFARGGAWARAAVDASRPLVARNTYAAVASSGPPHMAHVAALRIAKDAGAPLIADFRDPWSLVERVPEHIASPVWFRLARRHESRIVREATLVTMNTDEARDAMRALYPEASGRIVTIRNGADEGAVPSAVPGRRFAIRFAGTVYLDRDPRLVFRAAASVIAGLSLSPADFGFDFIGTMETVGGLTIEQIAIEEGIREFVTVGPLRPHGEAMEFLSAAQMLLSLPQDSDMAIPAKIYEYVRFPAWLLVLAPPHSATAALLRGTVADVVAPTDITAMAAAIRSRVEQFRSGAAPSAVNADGRFDRRRQAERLLAHLDEVTRR